MTNNLTVTQLASVENRRNEFPLVWCVEIPIPDPVTPSVLRITSHSAPVAFLTDSAGVYLEWLPYPLQIAPVSADTKGTQQTLRVTISNANRQLMALVDAYEGLEEQTVRIYLVPLNATAEGRGVLDLRGRIIAINANQASITFELGQVDMRRAKFPSNRVSNQRCGYVYKSERCGYVGAIDGCDKGLNTPNGCVAHANENRYGGFPGVPRT